MRQATIMLAAKPTICAITEASAAPAMPRSRPSTSATTRTMLTRLRPIWMAMAVRTQASPTSQPAMT